VKVDLKVLFYYFYSGKGDISGSTMLLQLLYSNEMVLPKWVIFVLSNFLMLMVSSKYH